MVDLCACSLRPATQPEHPESALCGLALTASGGSTFCTPCTPCMPVSSDGVGLGSATAGQRIEVEVPTSYKFLGMCGRRSSQCRSRRARGRAAPSRRLLKARSPVQAPRAVGSAFLDRSFQIA
jgi:hypothetical protein